MEMQEDYGYAKEQRESPLYEQLSRLDSGIAELSDLVKKMVTKVNPIRSPGGKPAVEPPSTGLGPAPVSSMSPIASRIREAADRISEAHRSISVLYDELEI